MKKIPNRWLDYQPMGQSVSGTKMIPFKVPLTLEACSGRVSENDWFTPAILLQKQPRLKTIIDLTDTNRYYDPQDFESNGVRHIKINITGGGMLPRSIKIQQFFNAVDEFMEKYSDDPDALIGVHCTHGLNRTGYFICNYMVDRLKVSPEEAISRFESARGYPMERKKFVDHIKNRHRDRERKQNVKPLVRNYNEYSSPLDGAYEEETRRDFQNKPSYSRDKYRNGGTSTDHRRYDEQNSRKLSSNDHQWRNRDVIDNDVTSNQSRGAWKSWGNHPRNRKVENEETTSSSQNWRTRP